MTDVARAREAFEGSTDFTVGLEEEFAILDPATLELAGRFDDLAKAAEPKLDLLSPSRPT